MDKPEIAFTEDEWSKLHTAGIEPDNFDDHSFHDIVTAIKPDTGREKQLRKIFFGNTILPTSLNPVFDTVQKLSRMPTYAMSAMLAKANSGTLSAVNPFMQHIGASTALTLASTVSKSLSGMDQFITKPAWQELLKQTNGINELAKPFGILSAVNAFLDAPTSISAATRIAESFQTHPYLNSGTSAALAYVNKMENQISAVVNPQRAMTALLNSVYPYEHSLVHTATINAVTGSLLDMNRYKDLGISAIAQSFSVNQLERGYAGGILDTMKASSAFTRMGEDALSKFDWATVGGRLDLPKSIIGPAQTGFLNFTKGYRDVLESVSAKPNWLYEAPTIAQLPAEEYYTSSQILRLVSDDDVSDEEVAEETKQAVTGQSDYLLEYLPRLDTDLPMMWHGAIYALRSDNPDKIRHFITSLRELFNHVIHILSPNDMFERWDTQKTYYDNGKPTRQGRLVYICRNMEGSDQVFSTFMKNDINSAISLIKMFQSGTHKIKSNYSPHELELIMIRAELSLRTFLKIEFDINRR